MREESHLDDMRSAIRGDFERLAERRGSQELMSVSPEEPAPEPEHEPKPKPVSQREPVPGPIPEPTHAAPGPGDAMAEPGPDATRPEDPRRSWLDRLLGR